MLASAITDETEMVPRRRPSVTPAIELAVLALAAAVAVASYLILRGESGSARLMTPPLVALMLVANLIPGILLLMLLGRRVARARAIRSGLGSSGQLHVRLVAIFSSVAAVPLILVTIFASLLFQYGVEFWNSDRARGMMSNTTALLQLNYREELRRVQDETTAMSVDLSDYLRSLPIGSDGFADGFAYQLFQRNLSEAAIIRRGETVPLAMVNPYDQRLNAVVSNAMMDRIDAGASGVVVQSRDRAGALVRFGADGRTYLYAARVFTPEVAAQWRRGEQIARDYRTLVDQSRTLQLRFNAALLVVSLLIVALAVWIALRVADRLVRPVGELVAAARRVADGDLQARVPDARTRDEVGTLATAFNQMTQRLQAQNGALVAANDQLDSRRALIEAVMGGVSAGVVAIREDGVVGIANRSASALLGAGEGGLVGRRLSDVAPELAQLLSDGVREATAQVRDGADARTLAVRVARTDAGPILTFDDITQQLTDQRRAAWADVARRIAHEIKNPLTPIQLAAERLQRRYGGKVEPGDTVFQRLTETIVRQVGDLRRMVDEFSSFARMPKPVFRRESLADIARQTLFLHEVAHPAIRFTLDAAEPGPALVCDRRQIGQALTNIVKNAAEAIDARGGEGGAVTMRLGEEPGVVCVEVTDDGIGLPADRERIVEPYVTTRARGTGLGLAIVKKIVEEHCGTIRFSDREGGGTRVTMTFDTAALAALEQPDAAAEPQLAIAGEG
jgi:two-component system, NtrC family, nitrogen regulation sensor histidine kinase NtrY